MKGFQTLIYLRFEHNLWGEIKNGQRVAVSLYHRESSPIGGKDNLIFGGVECIFSHQELRCHCPIYGIIKFSKTIEHLSPDEY